MGIKDILKNGGATLNKNGEAVSFNNGYQVSKKDCYILTVENVARIEKAVIRLLKKIEAGDFVGIWVDDGKAYIDISERIQGLEKALTVGRKRGQISIFEWATGDCVKC